MSSKGITFSFNISPDAIREYYDGEARLHKIRRRTNKKVRQPVPPKSTIGSSDVLNVI